jgi:hypothetical protein
MAYGRRYEASAACASDTFYSARREGQAALYIVNPLPPTEERCGGGMDETAALDYSSPASPSGEPIPAEPLPLL